MHRLVALCFAVLISLTVNAQTINLRGVVSDQAGKPVANAVLTLVKQGLKDTTGTDGAYSFISTAAVMPMLVPQSTNMVISKGFLEFSLPNTSPVKIETFDVQGNLLKRESFKSAQAGFYRFNIEESARATKLLVVKASIGRDEFTFRYLPLRSSSNIVNTSGENSIPVSTKLSKITAVDDTLKITAANYKEKAIPITSYDLQQNVTLESSSGGSTGSAGCGKTLSTLKSGTQTITSAGLSRRYIIDIPTNYDPSKPYRLIFGMHCMCNSMEGVQNEKYYGLKTLAEKAGVQCIYVAPSAYATDYTKVASSCIVWSQGEKDHTFFDDMLKLFKAELCVDTTRVFSAGFSFGAMFTYSLSTNHQKVLRAVATYAPANYRIYLPTNTHEPIAYYQTTGTTDITCPWVNSDANKEGGKYCVLQHAEDNGCNTNMTIKLATSGKHEVTEFTGCKEGYPVKFGSFQGGHSGTATDGGSSENWIATETWEFFMRF
jgi:poly(3-hydroxybutyrate) depolymerase